MVTTRSSKSLRRKDADSGSDSEYDEDVVEFYIEYDDDDDDDETIGSEDSETDDDEELLKKKT